MKKLKVGIIGAGSLSEVHFDAYKNNPDVELVAVCDLIEDRATAKAESIPFLMYIQIIMKCLKVLIL